MKTLKGMVSLAALVAAGFAQPGLAQSPTPAANEGAEGDIIVTARKREESLQDVPLSVAAFTSERIEEAGLRSIGDLAQQTLGFSFREGFGRNADRPVIRGMANIQGNANAAFFVDGIFVTGSIASFQLDNLERVEVVKGPQSALFGRATFSGAINYITRKPDNEFRGRVAATVGADEFYELTGWASGPIVRDKLYVEANARFYNFGGQYTNVINPSDKLGRQRTYSLGATVRWTPTETLDIVGRVGWAFDRDGHYPISRISRIVGQALPVTNQLIYNPGGLNCFLPELTGTFSAGRPVSSNRTRGYRCGEIQTPTTFALNTAEYAAAGFPDGLRRDFFRSSIRADLDVNDWTFTLIGAANTRRQIVPIDQDYSDLRALSFETIDGSGARDKQVEFKVLSPVDSRIRGLLGLFYYDEKDIPSVVQNGRVVSGNFAANLNVIVPNPANPATNITRSFVVGDNPNLIIRNPISRGLVENKAVFGQLEADITDTLKASVEARYQEETVTSIGTSTATVTVAGVPTVFSRAINESGRYRSFLPRATVDWKVTPDALLYGVVAKGNKPGGINAGLLSAVYDDAEVARFRSLGITTFKEEQVWSYELGAKTSWLGGRLTVNAAAFLLDWTNQQLTQTFAGLRRDGVPANIAPTVNIGRSQVKGFEIELNGQLTDTIDVRLGYSLTDAKVKDFVNDDQADLYITAADIAALNAAAPLPTGTPATNPNFVAQFNARLAAANALIAQRGQAAGQTLPRTPRHQLQGSVNWSQEFDGVRVFARADYAYESKRFTQIDNLGWAGDSHILNVRAGFELGSGVTLTAFVTNLLNDRTAVDTLRSIDNGQTVVRPPLRPNEAGAINIRDFPVTAPRLRNFGVTASYRW
jgi:iron complex outermembrane recepter protein